jgi:hypothetical protein
MVSKPGAALPENRAALTGQDELCDPPTGVELTEQTLRGDLNVDERRRAEFVDTGHRLQWARGHARHLHIHQKRADTPRSGTTGTGQHDASGGVVGPAGPQFLAVDHPAVATPVRGRPHRSQVAARFGLGEPLTPEFLAAQQPRKDLLDHFGPAELGHRGPEHFVHRPGRGVHQRAAGELLAEDGAQQRRTSQTADPRRPSPAHPAGVEKQSLHSTLVAQLSVNTLVLDRGDQRLSYLVNPASNPGAKIAHLHNNPRSQDSMNPEAT